MSFEDRYEYHPHRKDGLDKNLRRLNGADYRVGARCTCEECLNLYEDSRKWARTIAVTRGWKGER